MDTDKSKNQRFLRESASYFVLKTRLTPED